MRLIRPAAVAGLLALAGLIAWGAVVAERPFQRKPLVNVYTPTFSPVPPPQPVGTTLAELRQRLQTPRGADFLQSAVPGEAGVLWITLLLTLLVAFDFEHPRNPWNTDLILLQSAGFVLFGILRFLDGLRDAAFVQLMDWVFTALVALNVLLIGRALARAARPVTLGWRSALPTRALRAAALALLVADITIALVREPDDVGFFVNLGAQRLRERGELPYGDPLLTGSPGAAYGPLLYAAHVPFQLMLSPRPINQSSPDQPELGASSTYFLPPALATKLCTIAFHLAGVAALFVTLRRLYGERPAWAAVVLYTGSAYVLGVGGERYFIGGMTYISHIAPPAATLVAFSCLARPGLAGVMLAAAAGVGFYPAFLAPAWLGYYWDRSRDRWRFLSGFAATALAIGVGVLLLSRPAGGRGLIGTILWDTFGHHTDPGGYGSSPFSFWGQRGGIRGWLMTPLVANSGFSTPMFLVFVVLAVYAFMKARRSGPHVLALLTAAVAVFASLLKIHPTGTYLAWSYPFFLIGFMGAHPAPLAPAPEAGSQEHVSPTPRLQPAAREAEPDA